MPKTLGEALYGLTAEIKKKIRQEIKSAQSARSKQGSKEQDTYWDGLSALKTSMQDLVDKAKAAGEVPKGTTIAKVSKIPSTKPKRWDVSYNKLFGRKPRKAKSAVSPAPKTKPRKATTSKNA